MLEGLKVYVKGIHFLSINVNADEFPSRITASLETFSLQSKLAFFGLKVLKNYRRKINDPYTLFSNEFSFQVFELIWHDIGWENFALKCSERLFMTNNHRKEVTHFRVFFPLKVYFSICVLLTRIIVRSLYCQLRYNIAPVV